MLEDVVGEALVNLGLTILHGLDGIENEGKLLIFHLHQPGRLGAGHLVLRHHRGHVVAIVAHVPVEQKPVRHILMGFLHGPGMAGRREGDIGHVASEIHHLDAVVLVFLQDVVAQLLGIVLATHGAENVVDGFDASA